jgi:hypothetical protein
MSNFEITNIENLERELVRFDLTKIEKIFDKLEFVKRKCDRDKDIDMFVYSSMVECYMIKRLDELKKLKEESFERIKHVMEKKKIIERRMIRMRKIGVIKSYVVIKGFGGKRNRRYRVMNLSK